MKRVYLINNWFIPKGSGIEKVKEAMNQPLKYARDVSSYGISNQNAVPFFVVHFQSFY